MAIVITRSRVRVGGAPRQEIPQVRPPAVDMESGVPKTCSQCRFWSDRIARAHGGPLEAMCLALAGPQARKFVRAKHTCSAWKKNVDGAVDAGGAWD
jgi:hypothetical protein